MGRGGMNGTRVRNAQDGSPSLICDCTRNPKPLWELNYWIKLGECWSNKLICFQSFKLVRGVKLSGHVERGE